MALLRAELIFYPDYRVLSMDLSGLIRAPDTLPLRSPLRCGCKIPDRGDARRADEVLY